MAGDSFQCGQLQIRQHRLRTPTGPFPSLPGATQLVGPVLGPNRLLLRPDHRSGRLRHRRLRLQPDRVQRRRRQPARHARRVHYPLGRAGLLRRQPRRRLQPPHTGRRHRRHRRVPLDRLRHRPEPAVPARAEGRERRGL